MTHDPRRIAVWRFEQISALLDQRLTPEERRRMMEAMSRVPVVWPSGREEPVGLSTLYRWLERYQKDPRIESLMPRGRSKENPSPAVKPEWVEYALSLAEEEPQRSLYTLGLQIRDRFGLDRPPVKSSLHRALKQSPRYQNIRRRGRPGHRLRTRFQADHVHDIWHGDAKAVFTVKFTDGTSREVRFLSLLDDASRYVLRALVVVSESTATAVATFRQAAARWGLPGKLYADRHSAYDSDVFRRGLAALGVHRINTRPRNAPAHGKIEAYHRVLQRWFITELKHQPVLDLRHLQELLDAVIDQAYHDHRHRELKMTPRQAFGAFISRRLVTLERLREAFMESRDLSVHPRTGDVRVEDIPFRLPRSFTTRPRAIVWIDPEEPGVPYLQPTPGVFVPLEKAVKPAGHPEKPEADPGDRTEPAGSLTPLLERYRGRQLPQARAGFGLPEIYRFFSETLGRTVPGTEAEAASVLEWIGRRGPFDPLALRHALDKAVERLGHGRPLSRIIKEIERHIRPALEKE